MVDDGTKGIMETTMCVYLQWPQEKANCLLYCAPFIIHCCVRSKGILKMGKLKTLPINIRLLEVLHTPISFLLFPFEKQNDIHEVLGKGSDQKESDTSSWIGQD